LRNQGVKILDMPRGDLRAPNRNESSRAFHHRGIRQLRAFEKAEGHQLLAFGIFVMLEPNMPSVQY
jgi:hypothetical protein